MKRVKQMILGIFLLGIAAVLMVVGIRSYMDSFAAEYIIREAEETPEAEAVLVLGAFVSSEGEPAPVLAARLEHGYELYKLGKVKKILVSGDHGREYYDEVNAMKDYLINKGVPKEDIFMDHAGFNTYDSMYRAKEIFQIEKMLISTQEFHMTRSIYIARTLGIDAYGYPTPDREMYRMDYLNFREGLARVKAFFDAGVIRRKPKFLGEPIPIDGDGSLTDDKTRF